MVFNYLINWGRRERKKRERVRVNFTNILRKAFMQEDPKSAKNTEDLTEFYAFGICAHKSMLMKLALGVNFTNVLCAAFMLVGP